MNARPKKEKSIMPNTIDNYNDDQATREALATRWFRTDAA